MPLYPPSNVVGSTSVVLTVGAPTGIAATDTAAIQAKLDAAAAAGGGDVLLSAGTYVHTGLDIDTKVCLRGQRRATVLKSAPNIGRTAIRTKNFATLTGTDNATAGGVPHDLALLDFVQDGDKANQSSTSNGIDIYAYAFKVSGVVTRNNKGRGFYTEHSTQSVSTGEENSMVATLDDFFAHTNDLEGWEFRGPHDMQSGDLVYFFQNNMTNSGSKSQLWVPNSGGRANGAQFGRFHAWGGYSDYGAVIAGSGVRLHTPIIEGGIVAQLWLDIDQVQVYDSHLYTGGVNTATAKGIVCGHTGSTLNGSIVTGRVENCGGGAFDLTFLGDHNDLYVRHFYYSGTTPTLTALGWVGSEPGPKNDVSIRPSDGSFVPTAQTIRKQAGPLKIAKANSSDTRNLLEVNDETGANLYIFDKWGRPIAKAGVPTAAAGAQQGSGASPATVTGFDIAGTLAITTGTTPAAGQIAGITFAHTYGTAPIVQVIAKDAATQALGLFVTVAATGFSVRCANAPTAATTYNVDYLVVGKTS